MNLGKHHQQGISVARWPMICGGYYFTYVTPLLLIYLQPLCVTQKYYMNTNNLCEQISLLSRD